MTHTTPMLPYLPIALDVSGKPWHITEVPSGRSELRCPFCGQQVMAKKGIQTITTVAS